MSRTSRKAALDGPAARLVAGFILLAAIAALLAIHWHDLFPEEVAQTGDPNDPVALCIAERSLQIEAMVAENPGMADRKPLFLERAEAMCRSTLGGPSGPPPLPN